MRILQGTICLLFLISYALGHNLPICESISKVNINTASVDELLHVYKGIGKQRAQGIVDYRLTHGAFSSVAELALVKKIGLNFIKHHLLKLETVFTVVSR